MACGVGLPRHDGKAVNAAPVPARNIVLVHGLFADGSCWSEVIARLQAAGLNATALQNPLTTLPEAVASAERVLAWQDGPTVLVGHSFSGMIVTEAGMHPNVSALVYVAARAPDAGEDYTALAKTFPMRRHLDWQNLTGRCHAESQAAAGGEKLLRDQDREGRADGATDDSVPQAFVLEGIEISVMAGPCRGPVRTLRGNEVTHDVAVGIEDADLGGGTSFKSLLPAGLAEQGIRRENRRRTMVLAPQNGRLPARIVTW
jgi:pimeloyl-ACP methyl ester carboxylesterase